MHRDDAMNLCEKAARGDPSERRIIQRESMPVVETIQDREQAQFAGATRFARCSDVVRAQIFRFLRAHQAVV